MRHGLLGAFGILIAVVAVACSSSPPASSDDGSPDSVRVQDYTAPGWNCKVFTHDTSTYGGNSASMAVWCK